MANKIADFFAEIGIKADYKKLEQLDKKLDDLKRGLHNFEVDAKKGFKNASQTSNTLTKAIQQGNKALVKRKTLLDKINSANTKASRQSRQRDLEAAFGGKGFLDWRSSKWKASNPVLARNAAAWNKAFKQSVSSMTSGGLNASAYKRRQSELESVFAGIPSQFDPLKQQIRQRMAGKSGSQKFGNLVLSEKRIAAQRQAAQKIRDEINAAHATALKEYAKREASARREGRIRENNEKRLQAIAKRTEAIREAGARKAAAILQAAEIRRQAVARTAGRVGRPSSAFSGASFGGAIGAGASSVAGFLPGFGGAYAAMNFNKIGQELQQLENALLAVSGSEQAAAQNLAFLNEIGAEMGKTVRGLGPEFVKLKASIQGTALDGQEQGIFRSFMKYGTVMGLDEEAMKGSFRAVSQMVSKQQVYAEELRGQLTQ